MARIARLTERDMSRLVRRVINEAPTTTFEDTPEGLIQYLKQVENINTNLRNIKKEGNIYKTNYPYSHSYSYNNGRFVRADRSSYDVNNDAVKNLTDAVRRRINDEKIVSSIYAFYSSIVESKEKSKDWDSNRRGYKVELYIPSWTEFQLMQNIA
jgi:hypothetical protein